MASLMIALLILSSGETAAPLSLRLDLSLQNDSLPQYFLVRAFLEQVDQLSREEPDQLANFLTAFNVLPDTDPGQELVREARLARAVLAASWREPTEFASETAFESYQRHRALADAKEVGHCFGRFLLAIEEVGRSPRGFLDLVRHELAPYVSLAYSDPADIPFFHQQDAAFRSGLMQALGGEVRQ